MSACLATRRDLEHYDHGPGLNAEEVAKMTEFFTSAKVRGDIRSGYLWARRVKCRGITIREIPWEYAKRYVLDLRPTSETTSCVSLYFIECAPYVKIGLASVVQARLRSIACHNPYPVSLIHTIPVPFHESAIGMERELHVRFLPHHHRGEWFHDCSGIRTYIAESKASQEKAA
jgi:hypothetical protein